MSNEDYRAIDASKLSSAEFDALTFSLRAGRMPTDAEATLANSAEAKKIAEASKAVADAAVVDQLRSDNMIAATRIRELEAQLASRNA